jgi:hypothetical protein
MGIVAMVNGRFDSALPQLFAKGFPINPFIRPDTLWASPPVANPSMIHGGES